MADGPSPFINKVLWAIVRWACGAGSRAVGLALLLSPLGASANHYSGGSITYRCLGAGQYQITLDLFLDCAGVAIIPQSLNFHSDCGEDFAITGLTYTSSQEVSQLCAAALPQSTCNGGPYFGIEHYQFQTVVALAPCDDWTIWWYICCRSGSVDLTGSMGMYIEANVNTALAACDNSPVFADQSLPYVCVNQPVYYNFGVNEPDGDSIAYRFISARYFGGVPQPVMYNAGYSGGTPVPGITLDPVTGQIVFTPMSIGNYVIAIEVEQFDANGNSIGTVMRDIMFVVMACTGNVPTIQGNVSLTGPPGTATLTGPNSIDICDGSPFCFSLTFNDPDPATVLSVTSQAAALLPGSTTTITGANPAVVQVCWTADADHSPVNVLFQAADGSCPVENTASVSVNITSSVSNGPPNAGTNGAVTACPGTPPVDLFTALGGTPDADGHWLSPSNSAHSGQFIVGTDVAGVYTYVAGNACGSATATVTVTVSNGSANAGSNGTLSLCSNAPAQTLFDDLGGSPQAGGSWTGPGGAPHTAMYDPAIDAGGVYTYTVAGGGACPTASATVTVTEVAAPLAGSNGTLSICSNGAAVALFASLTGTPQAGGTWTGPGGAAHGPNYNPAVDGPGTYTYTVAGTAPCANATATVTVTENAMPNAGLDGLLSICSNGAATNLFPLLAGAQGGGSWTAPGGAPFSGTYDPAVDATGTYTYTVAGTAPCANDQAVVTVTESGPPNAGTDGTLTTCSNSGTSNLFLQLAGAQGGGTWTAPGGGAFSGTYDPAVHAAGVYTYTVAGVAPCGNDQATVTVSENVAPSAGADGIATTCGNGAAVNLFGQLVGAQAGGTWTAPGGGAFSGTYDPAVDAPGIYTYTVTGVAPCLNDQAVVTVTENAAPNAGVDGILATCSNSGTTNLFTLLVGAQAGGTWTAPGGGAFSGTYDPAVDASGIYTYILAGIAPCGNDQATVIVTEGLALSAGVDGALTICSNGSAVGLLAQLAGAQAGGTWTAPGGGAFSGTYDPTVDAPGIYTYTVAGVAPCLSDQATVAVQEIGAPNAGANGTLTTCSNSSTNNLFGALVGAQGGGFWTAPGGGAFGGTYDPPVDGPGVYTYTIAGIAPCGNDQSTVTVTETAAPDAGTDGSLTTCDISAPTNLFGTLAGAQAGGTWTAPGGGAFSGTYDPAVDVPGAYIYTVPGVAPCLNDQATVNVTENTAPNAGADGTLTTCSNSGTTNLFGQLAGAQGGGTWMGPGGGAFSGTYDPAVDAPGIYLYTIVGPVPCGSDQASVTVTENAAPNAGLDGILTVCSNGAAVGLFAELTGAPAGGTWTTPGGAAFSGTYDPAVDAPGLYTYTVAGTAPCASDQAVVTVQESQAPSAGSNGLLSICTNSAAAVLFTQLTGADLGGTWTDPNGDPFGGIYDPASDVPGAYTYTVAGPLPCGSDQAIVTVVETAGPFAGADVIFGICSANAPTNLFPQLPGAQPGGTWTGPLGGPFSGVYDPATDGSGAYTYTVAGSGPCAADQAVVNVVEGQAPHAGADAILDICSDSPAASLFPLLVGAQPGGTWTAPGGGAFGGTYDPAVNGSGVYTYSVPNAPPCLGDQATVTVTEHAAPNPGADAATTVCDQGAAIDLFDELPGADAGGTWTAPGGAAHNTMYDPVTDAPGTYTYTVAGVAPCGAAQSIVVVQETGAPSAGVDGSLTLCPTSGATDLFNALTGADPGGTWTAPGGAAHSSLLDPAVDAAGVYTYTIAAVVPCAGDQSQVTVAINAAPDAGTDGATTVCDQGAAIDLFNELTGADAGGTWTAPGGAAHSNLYDPSVDPPGTYTYTVVGTAPCGAAQSVVVVQETGTPNAGTNGTVTLCSTSGATDLFNALVGADPGGAWTAPGGAAHSNLLDPAVDAVGVYTYTIAAVAPCAGDQSQVTVAINVAPDAGIDGAVTVCDQGASIDLFNELTGADAGGSWAAPGGGAHSNLYDPSVDPPGTYTYTVAGTAPCGAAQSVVVVQETSTPNAGGDGTVTLCSTSGAIDLF
ncbi:MAG: hypothetical protein JST66_04410, partial [Bacteroidetes bacterium]|nr:hypothetical protein [Bacteroidota bacterium]